MKVYLTKYVGSIVLIGLFLPSTIHAKVAKKTPIPIATAPVVKQPTPISVSPSPATLLSVAPEKKVEIVTGASVQRTTSDVYKNAQVKKVQDGYLPHFISVQLGGLPTAQKALQIRVDYDYNYCFGKAVETANTKTYTSLSCGLFVGAHFLGGYNFDMSKGLIGLGGQISYLFDITNRFKLGPFAELGLRIFVPGGTTTSTDPTAKISTYYFSSIGGIYASFNVLEFMDIFAKIGLGAWIGSANQAGSNVQFATEMGVGLKFNLPRYVDPASIAK